MARTRTLANLRADVRYQADIESETRRHPDTKITRLLNQSIQAFRLLISQAGHPYYLAEATGTFTSGTDDYALPATCVEVYGIDVTVNGYTYALHPYMFGERNDYAESWQQDSGTPVLFRVQDGNNVRIIPTPDDAYAYTIHYLPTGTDLSSDSDTFDGIAGWEDWIVYDTAAKVLARDDDDEQHAKMERLRDKREAEIRRDAGKRVRIPSRRIDTLRRRGDVVASSAERWR